MASSSCTPSTPFMSVSCLTSNDYSILRSELLNLSIWSACLFGVYILFDDKPYLFNDPSYDIWVQTVSKWPYHIRYLYLLLALIFNSLPLFFVSGYYDIIHKYNLFASYRITEQYPSATLIADTISYDLKLWFIFLPLYTCFLFNPHQNFDQIPNLWIICVKLLAAIYLFDILFHVSHQLLHTSYFYKYHKIHHEYKQTISWAATWSSIVELFVSNLTASSIPVLLLNLHPFTTLLYIMYRNIETCVSHSGYDLPFYVSPLFIMKYVPGHYEQERLHAFHHSHNDGCFGFYFTDSMFGSNGKFRKHYFAQKLKKSIQKQQ